MYLALRKCKNDCKILKIILVLIFVHCNLILHARFPIGFRLNILEAVIVLGLGECFCCLFCCSLEEYRVVHASLTN